MTLIHMVPPAVSCWSTASRPDPSTVFFGPESALSELEAVAVTFEVSVDAGTPVRCAVEALNTAYGVVGWVELDLPPADAHTSSHRVDVRTSELATTGLVSECWVTYDVG